MKEFIKLTIKKKMNLNEKIGLAASKMDSISFGLYGGCVGVAIILAKYVKLKRVLLLFPKETVEDQRKNKFDINMYPGHAVISYRNGIYDITGKTSILKIENRVYASILKWKIKTAEIKKDIRKKTRIVKKKFVGLKEATKISNFILSKKHFDVQEEFEEELYRFETNMERKSYIF